MGQGGDSRNEDKGGPPKDHKSNGDSDSDSDSNDVNENFSPKAVDLKNGAVVVLDISSPADNKTNLFLEGNATTHSALLEANARVIMGAPDVHYIYVVDSSYSTYYYDGDCGKTLDCEQKFFYRLHREIENDKSARIISMIDFDSDANVLFENLEPSNADIGISILAGKAAPDGATCCDCALRKAEELTKKYAQSVNKTVVFFAGDGHCNSDDLEDVIQPLENAGVVVHTVAVGDEINCMASSDQDPNAFGTVKVPLSDLTVNGGECFDLADPNNVTDGLLKNMTRASLTKFEIKIDGGEYTDLEDLSMDHPLPQENVPVKYSKAWDLAYGQHVSCFRATGEDPSGTAQVMDCRNLSIRMPITEAPTSDAPTSDKQNAITRSVNGTGKILGIFIAVVVILIAGMFVLWRMRAKSVPATTPPSASFPPPLTSEKEEVVATGVPVQVV